MPIPQFDGPEFLINTTRQGSQGDPTITALPDGRFVVAWTDGSQTGGDTSSWAIRGQIFAADGAPSGSEFLVNTTTQGLQWQPTITALPDDRFVVAWTDSSQTGFDIRGQIFAADGTPSGAEFLINTTTQGQQSQPTITALPDGRFVVAWEDYSQTGGDTSGWAVRGQVFAADGALSGAEFLVNTTTQGSQYDSTLTALPDGRFVVAWQDYSQTGGDTSNWAIRGQIFAADGAPSGAEFLINTTTQSQQSAPTLTALPDGRFVVAWQDYSQTGGDTSGTAVRGQIFAADGAPLGSEFLINTTTQGSQSAPTLTALPDGRFVVAWQDYSQTGGDTSGTAVRGQIFAADGAPLGSEFLINTTTQGSQSGPTLTALPDGRLVVAWTDRSEIGGLRGQILTPTPLDLFVRGTENDDVLTGRSSAEFIDGLGGDDMVTGDGGNDTLRGGDGADTIYGGLGDDDIGGGAGDDIIRGEGGRDTIYGGFGNDNIGGGAGNDVIYAAAGHNLIWGGLGDDLIQGAWGSDTIYGGGDGTNTLHGGAGEDVIAAGAGGDLIDAGAGDDTIVGGAGPDTIHGGDGDDLIYGRGDNNTLEGGDGDDRFDVTGDNSRLFGGAGNDRFSLYGTGNHELFGGTGDDIFHLQGTGSYEVFGGDGADYIRVPTASGNHRMFGDAGDDTINGGFGNDFIGGGAGNDDIRGDDGADTIWGGFGSDTIRGDAGDDLIFASAGSGNVLYGGRGDDTMVASTGRDVLHSERFLTDEDVFVFNSAAHIGIGPLRDIIFNFDPGQDQIDLSALNTAFNGTAGLVGGGQASFYHFTRPGMVSDLLIGDQTGNGVADWVLDVNFLSYWYSGYLGAMPDPQVLLESDFIL